MTSNPYIDQKAVATRHAEIYRTMQQSRVQASPKEQGAFVRYAVSKLGGLLTKRDAGLPQARQQSEVYG